MRFQYSLVVSSCALLLGIGIWFFGEWQNPFKIPIVRQIKLLDVDTRDSQGFFGCPKALNYMLVLAVPSGYAQTNPIAGEIVFSTNETNVLRFNLKSVQLVSCNWLDNHGLKGFLVEAPLGSNHWDFDVWLRDGLEYKLTVKDGPIGSSIWLIYRYPSGWDVPLIGKRNRD